MPSAPVDSSILTLSVTETDGTVVLRLDGEFDLAAVGPAENVLDQALRSPTPARLVFDLRDLEFLDLSGLRTILRASERGRGLGCEVVVVRPRGTANRVFTLTRAGEELKMVDQVPEASAPSS